jgi:hypothetical protein
MNSRSVNRVGGLFAIVAAVMYVVVGISVLLDPSKNFSSPLEFFTGFIENPQVQFHQLYHLAFGLAGLFLLAVVPAIARQLSDEREGWVKWISSLAYLGLFLTAFKHFHALGSHVQLAKAYVEADAASKSALLEASRLVGIDPFSILTFGIVGIWYFLVSLFALQERRWPALLCIFGFISGATYWLVSIGEITNQWILGAIAAGLGGVIAGPIWLIWLGVRLRRTQG